MDSMLAELKSVGVIRNGHWLIRNIDLSIRRGEIVSLIGPNGSGKTTAVNVLCGSIAPDSGSVNINRDVSIGYVPQRINISPTLPMTVRRLLNINGKFSKFEVNQALDEMNIRHLARQSVQELSGGEFQRALFARALLRNPDLLVLDEPSQGLDIKGEIKLYDQVVDIRDRLNCGVLLVSHNLHMVMAKTDTVVCINVHVCCAGEPVHIVNEKSFEELFGHDTARSHALYRHHHDHSHLPDGSVSNLE